MNFARGLKKTGEMLRKLHWTRGLRAGLAVAAAMIVCYLLGKPMGWAALGGFEAILVDNGGPYRSRFATIATLMFGGTLACLAGAAAVGHGSISAVVVPMVVTAAFCFAATFARVAAQPIASTSVIILVIYFAALGSSAHSFPDALGHALAFVLGGAWAAALSLFLWPVDPFRPARLAVSQCYESLASFTSGIGPTERGSAAREAARTQSFAWQRRMRLQMETARAALGATAARAPSRTVRARNLIVLLETADMLLAATMRMTELVLGVEVGGPDGGKGGGEHAVSEFMQWLSGTEQSIALALRQKPVEQSSGSSPRGLGSQAQADIERIRRQATERAKPAAGQRDLIEHLAAVELDSLQNVEIACEAVKAVWSGTEARAGTTRLTEAVEAAASESARKSTGAAKTRGWAEALRANWTFDSVMMRHALRMMAVGAADILLLHFLHIAHGFWLGMTSIIVLQPYQSNTLKRGVERVGGTIAGGILAAVLAVLIPSQAGIIAVVTATSVLTLATYAVDYAWYCFFLTPTFVLMSLPHLRDWQYSGVRMLTTVLGAAVAVAAMRLLWPEREHRALGGLLARATAAETAYIRALLRYWQVARPGRDAERRRLAESEILAPARRACGLAANDIEESLDRLMLESGFGRLAAPTASPALTKEHALTFVTYLRRFTQSVTTLAVLGSANRETVAKLKQLADRLETVGAAFGNVGAQLAAPPIEDDAGAAKENSDVATHQMQRMERQVAILERTAAGLLGNPLGAPVVRGREVAV
jgi:uncharacterized membrane protein YccC